MDNAKRSNEQISQDKNRDSRGRFKAANECECCKGRAPHNYYSVTDTFGKYWHVLCRKCAVQICDA